MGKTAGEGLDFYSVKSRHSISCRQSAITPSNSLLIQTALKMRSPRRFIYRSVSVRASLLDVDVTAL